MTRIKPGRMAGALLALAGLLLTASGRAADTLPVKPFKARYGGVAMVKLKPVDLSFKSNMELTLSDAGNGRYRMESVVSGVVGSINSQVDGAIQGEEVRPLLFQQTLNTMKTSQTQARFDWQNKKVETRDDDEQRTLPLTDGVVDPLSLYLLAMWDLQSGRKPRQYTLVSGVRLKTYKATLEGEETLATGMGKLRALRVVSRRDKDDDNDRTILWFAPELGYMPAQLVRIEDGKEMLRMTIQAVEGGAR